MGSTIPMGISLATMDVTEAAGIGVGVMTSGVIGANCTPKAVNMIVSPSNPIS